MNKNNLSKSQKELYEKLLKLSKTTKVRPKQIKNHDAYQFISSDRINEEKGLEKNNGIKWILVDNNNQLVGRLDYNPKNTRESARKWFYDTKRMVNKHDNFDENFRVLTNDEFEELKKNDKPRIRFASRNASIYKDSPIDSTSSKSTKKKKESFLEFLSRAPISFDEGDE
jgi:hypothetical protein